MLAVAVSGPFSHIVYLFTWHLSIVCKIPLRQSAGEASESIPMHASYRA